MRHWGLHGQTEKQKQQLSPFMGFKQKKIVSDKIDL